MPVTIRPASPSTKLDRKVEYFSMKWPILVRCLGGAASPADAAFGDSGDPVDSVDMGAKYTPSAYNRTRVESAAVSGGAFGGRAGHGRGARVGAAGRLCARSGHAAATARARGQGVCGAAGGGTAHSGGRPAGCALCRRGRGRRLCRRLAGRRRPGHATRFRAPAGPARARHPTHRVSAPPLHRPRPGRAGRLPARLLAQSPQRAARRLCGAQVAVHAGLLSRPAHLGRVRLRGPDGAAGLGGRRERTVSAAPPAPVQSGRILPAQAGLRADVVVVGTGAGGAMAARELARRGLDVIALEEGGYRTPRDFNQREDEMLALLFAERGARATADLAIHVLQGRGVGGSTVHNTNLCKRMPDAILEQWALEGGSPRELAPLYQATERDLDVAPMDWQALNPNNDRFRVGVSKLGYRGGFLAHNRRNCVGSGFCELGCSFNAKQNALKLLVPQAAAAGARIFSDVRAERITTAAGRASGVEATVLSPDGRPAGRLQVTARAV